MDLNVDFLNFENNSFVIAIAHNFIQNGDLMCDPEMEIRINPHIKMAEALTYQQDSLAKYEMVYELQNGKALCDIYLKHELNKFLNLWLTNLINQGFNKKK